MDLKSKISKRERMRIAVLVVVALLIAASFTIGTILRNAEEQRAESVFHGATFVKAEERGYADGNK